MAATIKDLARHCGLSLSAVSKALNGYSDISEATRKAVMQAAKELDYHPNAHARALKSGRSYNLGVLFADDAHSGLLHPFFSVVLEHFKREAEACGYDITFISHRMGNGRMTYLDHCRYREVDGVCLACVHFEQPEIYELVDSDFPLVTIDRVFDNRVCVLSDNADGIKQLMHYVYYQGHRRIAFIHGPQSAVTDIRLNAFMDTARDLGLEVPPEYLGECTYVDRRSAYIAAQHMLALKERPTCIMASDDVTSGGVIEAIINSGLRMPDDVSVTGYDGIQYAKDAILQLTTVKQDAEAIGRESARQLIRLIEGGARKSDGLVFRIPCTLVPGNSVRKING